ncbi:MAG: bifunctional nuclease family protein [Thermoanaerobacterales bacterium]|nr:bifunctional nuclease family protein [Thermoanaerobacterales bacterium]
MIPVHVKEIAFDPSMNPVLLLADEPEAKILPIWIGPFEAHAIAMALEGYKAERPLTHDLLQACCERLGVQITRAVISDVRDETFIAEVHLTGTNVSVVLDARPSDAVALAVRNLAPIFITDAVASHTLRIEDLVEQSRTEDDIPFNHLGVTKRTIH